MVRRKDIIFRSKAKKRVKSKGGAEGSWTKDAYGNPVWIPKGSKSERRPAGFPGHSKKMA